MPSTRKPRKMPEKAMKKDDIEPYLEQKWNETAEIMINDTSAEPWKNPAWSSFVDVFMKATEKK